MIFSILIIFLSIRISDAQLELGPIASEKISTYCKELGIDTNNAEFFLSGQMLEECYKRYISSILKESDSHSCERDQDCALILMPGCCNFISVNKSEIDEEKMVLLSSFFLTCDLACPTGAICSNNNCEVLPYW